ncbi:ShlB/FhaC/HecB family hemolysin secretion/activation protein [Oleiagrimonas soli]|uniref:Hemolysin activation/secretion protein n=1 Tax=Oleiagrimonas soli TaxID=1543381 RepID=A0A099CWV3_9GAMM|nr:POTRA domain-containing protein [Oleiagrimonas soli]KGI78229.1 hypothetical protein LF63_0107820 [Oleiagrimonas soli]MBB6183306.1 hemolysin activation/secretion protein [Oleiagrimonas soli]
MKSASIASLALLVATSAQAQNRPPPSNPLQTLPQVEEPKVAPSVSVHVQSKRNARLEKLLDRRITPKKFGVAGVRSLPFETVAALFRPLRGRSVTVGELLKVAKQCTALYRARGYPLSFCYLPAQDFAHGVVRVQVVEGYVADIQIEGDPGPLEAQVRAIAAHMIGERPLKRSTFERYVQVLGLLPGASVKVDAPPPSTTDGATRLKLRVQRKRYDTSAGIDFNHPGVQGVLSGTLYAPTSLADRLKLSMLYPRGRGHPTYYAAQYALPVYSDGLYLQFDGSRYRGTPDLGDALPTELRHRVAQDRIDMSLRYPLHLDHERAWFLDAGIYGTDQSDGYRNVLNGAALRVDTHTRVLQGGFDYRKTTAKRQRSFSMRIARGLDALGASSTVMATIPGTFGNDVDLTFTRVHLSFVQSDDWRHHFGSVLRLSGQYSPDRLPISEKITFGGPRFAHAYDPGIASGDSGWGASAEAHRRIDAARAWLKQLTPYLLTEYARTYAHNTHPDTLVSVALGLRLTDRRHYSVDISVAKPLRDRPVGDGSGRRGTRANLSIAYRFP